MSDSELSHLLLHHSIERFLVLEAELLDRQEFSAWLRLLDDHLSYVIPTQAITAAAAESASYVVHANTYVDEDKSALERRIRRLGLPSAWSEHPPSRTCRFVSNVRVTAESGDIFAVTSSLLVYRSRLAHDGALIAAARRDRIRRVDAEFGWRLVRREVQLLDTVIGMHNLSIIL